MSSNLDGHKVDFFFFLLNPVWGGCEKVEGGQPRGAEKPSNNYP